MLVGAEEDNIDLTWNTSGGDVLSDIKEEEIDVLESDGGGRSGGFTVDQRKIYANLVLGKHSTMVESVWIEKIKKTLANYNIIKPWFEVW